MAIACLRDFTRLPLLPLFNFPRLRLRTARLTSFEAPRETYTTRQEAEGAMKTVKVCESGGTVGGPVPVPR